MNKREKIYKGLLRARLRGQDFTIISNNCWGAQIYQDLGIAYQTPFVGLFLDPECYLNLLTRFHSVINNSLRFVEYSQRPAVTKFRERCGTPYPIALLDDDIELQFLHFQSEEEAAEKWQRRVARINPDSRKLFVKFCDHDRPTQAHLEAFDRLPFEHKVCFVSEQNTTLKSGVWIPETQGGVVPDGGALQVISRPYFDVADWLRGGSGRRKWYSIACQLWPRALADTNKMRV